MIKVMVLVLDASSSTLLQLWKGAR